MKNYCRTLFILIVASLIWAGSARAVLAGPHFTLSPASGSYTNGTEFKVDIGVETADTKAAGVDMWATLMQQS